ncbi:type III PLP-dependent enzyme [Vibrio parahaemolyticus]|uniref:type III PLP-dependent enzyme n=1 Tax=Vibrio parahaemolyticus TaxID=670 RepID=UPI0005F14792|nr:type III PLP-dependent enzyme [Vibrio parahaemolyticus]EGR0768875.1 type III PLP-dependent enzyme [Vibrio parahaemolyticus]EGR0837541.1 type III PLP-dependent enzyme [Vibrio parahaemolyticus]MDF4974144.1 type III PLP-dependent enzyme [Vibrio parahaemolyticus]MDF5036356.1 type III PLP-dependent enzyme [Vibrio parahaemolyticus]MDF5220477.1 type III PLP-dependent enzyme [Vibrio parahaemolyticus]
MSNSLSLPTRVSQQVHTLAQQQNQPLCAYVYDLNALEEHIKQLRHVLPKNVELFYAAKANPSGPILKTLAPHVDGFEAASGGELAHLHQQQLDKPLIFGGPGKMPSELQQAIELDVDAIHVESLTELQRIGAITERLNRPASIFLRMNIDIGDITLSKLAMGGKPTPFGLDESELSNALMLLRDFPQVSLKGFHFHLMSHQLDVERHLALMQRYFQVVKAWQQEFELGELMINLGGGMGINYQNPEQHFPWMEFCDKLEFLIAKEQVQDWTLRFECGRFITAACGYYVMEVLDIKQNLGENFVIARGGTHHFRTPAAQSHDHPFVILKSEQHHEISHPIQHAQATFVGQLCTPKDVLARNQHVAHVDIGDYVVFTLAGAYAWNISHQNFLMHEPPIFHYF